MVYPLPVAAVGTAFTQVFPVFSSHLLRSGFIIHVFFTSFPTIKHPPTVPAGGRCHLSTWSLLLSGFNLPVAYYDNQ